ncbi:MAG: response regulator [Rhodospirillaceae bacterium]|nr:response regulator [Rhodospirillaceae bacterium]
MSEAKTIFVIDDHETARNLLAGILASADYRVLTMVSAADALDQAKTRKPDLIVVDMNMPGMTGWEAAKAFRAMPETASTAILGVSAHSTAGDHDAAHAAGCNAYVTKPLNPARLLNAVAELLASN